MKILLRDITDQDTHLSFTQTDKWVEDVVFKLDEKYPDQDSDVPRPPLSPSSSSKNPSKQRPIDARFSLRKIDEVFLVSGYVKTSLELFCSRCATPFQFTCKPAFSALFCKDPTMAGLGSELQRPGGQTHGVARHAHEAEDPNESGLIEARRDLDITYLAVDYIDLAELMSEQLILQIPFQPLCQESCNGICADCGADLNLGHCACAQFKTNQSFLTLKNLKF